MNNLIISRDSWPTPIARQRSDRDRTTFEQSPAVYWGADLMNGLLALFCGASVIGVLFVVVT